MKPLIVYFSSKSGNTHRFVESLDVRALRIPFSAKNEPLHVDEPYILICPTYANDDGSKAVPKQVIRFLNSEHNRSMLRGVIGAGNRNFGEWFAHAGKVISKKCGVPFLYKIELSGTTTDTKIVKKGIEKLWATLKPNQAIPQTGT
ncbi:MAG: class Ib ribonucleoside-diphosphate reductase assembly flavoprotein NrdI [Bdellovibrionales bacterium]